MLGKGLALPFSGRCLVEGFVMMLSVVMFPAVVVSRLSKSLFGSACACSVLVLQ